MTRAQATRLKRDTGALCSGAEQLASELGVVQDEWQECPADAVLQRQAEYVLVAAGVGAGWGFRRAADGCAVARAGPA